jgi:CubicO group peptidase (beta-lactamase class C family)
VRLLAALLVLGGVGCGAANPPASAPAKRPISPLATNQETPPAAARLPAFALELDGIFQAAADADGFSGSVVIVDAGKQILAKGYGNARRQDKTKNAPDTIFRIGSVSKQFTASAVLRLAADGKLALTDPLSKFFPDYPKANLVKEGQEVTLHHLLSHTSGLPDPDKTPSFRAAVWKRVIQPSEQVNWIKDTPLVAKPGATHEYLNFNFLLAALVVEKVSGLSFEAYLKKTFFEPLGMTDTATTLPNHLASRAATGYYLEAKTFETMTADPSFRDPNVTFAFGSGQIFSTVLDLAKWDRALAGDQVLPAKERALLFTKNLDDCGYGWFIHKKAGVEFQWHNGAISPLGFSAFAVRVPSKDRFVTCCLKQRRQVLVAIRRRTGRCTFRCVRKKVRLVQVPGQQDLRRRHVPAAQRNWRRREREAGSVLRQGLRRDRRLLGVIVEGCRERLRLLSLRAPLRESRRARFGPNARTRGVCVGGGCFRTTFYCGSVTGVISACPNSSGAPVPGSSFPGSLRSSVGLQQSGTTLEANSRRRSR